MSNSKSTSIRLCDSTRDDFKKFVIDHHFVNQDEAVKFLLKAADFTQAASSMPIRQQTLNDIAYHMERIMDLIKSLFKSYGDMTADFERQLDEKDKLHAAEIAALAMQIHAFKDTKPAAVTPPVIDAGSMGEKEAPPAAPVKSPQETVSSINVVK